MPGDRKRNGLGDRGTEGAQAHLVKYDWRDMLQVLKGDGGTCSLDKLL